MDPEIADEIRNYDKEFDLIRNLYDFIYMGKIFGIRIVIFIIDSDDPEFYFKPFNPDGIKPGSYKGMTQIDPYWMTPELGPEAAGDPASKYFYEPTWWRANAKRFHRSHLIIYRTCEVPDILKPTYFYGGIPLPQQIYERVYEAERMANEATQLALTKRSTVVHIDLAQAIANQAAIENKMQTWATYRDNYGVKLLGEKEVAEQFDTSLSDLDSVIMTQYQIVAGAAGVPATKLLSTQPKGFNATGEFDEANYHEMLSSLQKNNLTPLIERHHLILMRSEIAPNNGIEPFDTTVKWNPLDEATAIEKAEVEKTKAETDAILINAGVINGSDARERIISDSESCYSGLSNELNESEESGNTSNPDATPAEELVIGENEEV